MVRKPQRDLVVVCGSLAQKLEHGGHTWVLLQYLLGLKRLGWDVMFLDRLESGMGLDAGERPASTARASAQNVFVDIMERYGLTGQFALFGDNAEVLVGLTRHQVLTRTRDAAILLNVMGFLADEEILNCARQRVFLDIDPGFAQMWQELGLHDAFQGYDHYVTIGENIGHTDCLIPTCGLSWITTCQPVVLDCWPVTKPSGNGRFTTVASWRGAYGPVEYRGMTFGLRVHEFRKFARLPQLTGKGFELALDIHPAESSDLELLRCNGWSLVDPRAVAGNPAAYQEYVRASKAEWMVAKSMYVKANSGWLSDRSLCYLATGKPVLAQDTGFGRYYPTGEGLLTFRTLEEACAGVEDIHSRYVQHAHKARELAEAYFDSDKVLSQLLRKLGAA